MENNIFKTKKFSYSYEKKDEKNAALVVKAVFFEDYSYLHHPDYRATMVIR
jgi:hypothetical protein